MATAFDGYYSEPQIRLLKWMLGMGATSITLAGIMAKGFHWW